MSSVDSDSPLTYSGSLPETLGTTTSASSEEDQEDDANSMSSGTTALSEDAENILLDFADQISGKDGSAVRSLMFAAKAVIRLEEALSHAVGTEMAAHIPEYELELELQYRVVGRYLQHALLVGNDAFSATLEFPDTLEHMGRLLSGKTAFIECLEQRVGDPNQETNLTRVAVYVMFQLSLATRETVYQDISDAELVIKDERSRIKRLVALSSVWALLSARFADDVRGDLAQSELPQLVLSRITLMAPTVLGLYGLSEAGVARTPTLAPLSLGGDDEVPIETWVPAAGDLVARGPQWGSGLQDMEDSVGLVLSVVSGPQPHYEVAVQWNPPETSITGPTKQKMNAALRGKVFVYKCGVAGSREVMPIADAHRLKYLELVPTSLMVQEFQMMCYIVQAFCEQREYSMLLHQHRAMHWARALIEVDILGYRDELHAVIRRHGLDVETFSLTNSHEEGPVLNKAVLRYRMAVEVCCTGLQLLGGLCSTNQNAVALVGLRGFERTIAICNMKFNMRFQQVCAVVLSVLTKQAPLSAYLRNSVVEDEEPGEKLLSAIDVLLECPSPLVLSTTCLALDQTLSCVTTLHLFKRRDGLAKLADLLKKLLAADRSKPSAADNNLLLGCLKAVFMYFSSMLLIIGRYFLQQNRSFLSLQQSGGYHTQEFLPRSDAALEAVVAALCQLDKPDDGGALTDYVSHTRVGEAQWQPFVRAVEDLGLHICLLQIAGSRAELRVEHKVGALSILALLAVAPSNRKAIATCTIPDPSGSGSRGIGILLHIVDEFNYSHDADPGDTMLPASSLDVLGRLLLPPAQLVTHHAGGVVPITSAMTEHTESYRNICGLFRAMNAIKTLLRIRLPRDPVPTKMHALFRLFACQVLVLASLRYYSDSKQLFDVLGVRKLAVEVQQYFLQFRQEVAADSASQTTEPLHVRTFMDNCLRLAVAGSSDGHHGDGRPILAGAQEDRVDIIGRSLVSYSQQSLLELVATHLEEAGLANSAATLRQEGNLPPPRGQGVAAPKQSLDGIVKRYIQGEQERAPKPIVTLPKVNLLDPQRYICPSGASPSYYSGVTTSRNLACHSLGLRLGLPAHRERYERFVHRTIRPAFSLRGSTTETTSMCFADGGNTLIVGRWNGTVAVYNQGQDASSDDVFYIPSGKSISKIVTTRDSSLVAAIDHQEQCVLMQRSAMSTPPSLKVDSVRAVQFAVQVPLMVCTGKEETALVYDVNRSEMLVKLASEDSLMYNSLNEAAIDPTGNLLLSNGVLWDLRCSSNYIYRFDRLSEAFSSTFHPLGNSVLVDGNVWDLRTMTLSHSSPHLLNCVPQFGYSGRYIYCSRHDLDALSSTVEVLHADTLELFATHDLRQRPSAFIVEPAEERKACAIHRSDTSFRYAVVYEFGHELDAGGAFHEDGDGGESEDEFQSDDWDDDGDEFDEEDDEEDDDDDDFEDAPGGSDVDWDEDGEWEEDDGSFEWDNTD